jgi:hypothetical protein
MSPVAATQKSSVAGVSSSEAIRHSALRAAEQLAARQDSDPVPPVRPNSRHSRRTGRLNDRSQISDSSIQETTGAASATSPEPKPSDRRSCIRQPASMDAAPAQFSNRQNSGKNATDTTELTSATASETPEVQLRRHQGPSQSGFPIHSPRWPLYLFRILS